MIDGVGQQQFPRGIDKPMTVARAVESQRQVRDTFSGDNATKDLNLIPKPEKALHGGAELLGLVALVILGASVVGGGVVGGVAAHMLIGTKLATWLGIGVGAVAGGGIAWKAMS